MDFDISDFFASFSFEDFGKAAQVAGVATSAVGAFFSTAGQQDALNAHAGLDRIQARTAYSASLASLNLESINAQMGFAAVEHSADMSVLKAQGDATTMRMRSEIGLERARASAASSGISAMIDDNEAHMAELRAQNALLHGTWEEQDVRLKVGMAKAKRRATMAARGIDMGSGNMPSVVSTDEVVGEMSVTRIRDKSLMAALGYRQAAENNRLSAQAKRASGGASLRIAEMEAQMTQFQAQSLSELAVAEADYKKAMAAAGLLNAEAAIDVKRTLAEAGLSTADAAADMKETTADGLSPWLSAGSSLLGGVARVSESWYRLNRTRN